MGFLQAESKRNFYTKDFIKIGLPTALTGGPDLGRVAFFFILPLALGKFKGTQCNLMVLKALVTQRDGMQAGKIYFIDTLAHLKWPRAVSLSASIYCVWICPCDLVGDTLRTEHDGIGRRIL